MIVSSHPKRGRARPVRRHARSTSSSSASRCSGCCRSRSRGRASSSSSTRRSSRTDPTLENYRARAERREPSSSAAPINSLKVATLTALLTTLDRAARGVRPRAAAGLHLEGRARLDPGQPDVPADPDHHPALPAPARPAPDELAHRPRPRLRGLGAAVRALDAAGYVRGIPRDLEEAAAVDGATRFQILDRDRRAAARARGSSSPPSSRSSRPGTSSSSPSSSSRPRPDTLPLGSRSSSGSRASSGSALWPRPRCSRPSRASSCSCYPALADARPALRGGEGLVHAISCNPRRRIERRQRPQKGGSQ